MMQLLRSLGRKYIAWAKRYPERALPIPLRKAHLGIVWLHPYYYRPRAWMDDCEAIYGALQGLLAPGQVFFDVGANVGQTCVLGATRVGRRGKVVAFEPAALNRRMLRFHLRWNRLKNVTVEPMCVGAAEGAAEFSLLDDGFASSNSLTFSKSSGASEMSRRATKVMVPITTLDAYCSRAELLPDVVKIDVEGAEYDVLLGARQVLLSKRPSLLLAVHPFWWPDSQEKSAIPDLLQQMGYTVTTLQGQLASAAAFGDFICLPRR